MRCAPPSRAPGGGVDGAGGVATNSSQAPFTRKHRCQKSLWTAIAAAGKALAKQQGTATPKAWRASSTALGIKFAPLNPFTMSYTNRPSGIQQVISFNGHR